MASLVIPETGISLGSARGGSSKPGLSAPPTAFGLTISDTVIEDMIKCVQNGQPIQLSLGPQPSLVYGTKTQHLSTSNDPFTTELFQSTNTDYDDDSSSDTETMSYSEQYGEEKLGHFTRHQYLRLFGPNLFGVPKPVGASSKPKNVTASTTGADTALAQLQNSLASEGQRKADNTTKFITNAPALPGQRKGAAKAANKKLLASNRLGADTLRSTPVSPALSGVGSPALAPTSVPLSQVAADKAKASRKPVIHLLATGPMTKAALREALPEVSDNDFDQALEKVADAKGNKWELTKKYWRELDVWTYDYATQEDRQRAIDNAVSKFDNLRLGVTEPEWDRLLPKAERGQGKCLSKLQAQIAQGTARPPKIKLQKDEGSGRDTSAGEEDDSIASKAISKVRKGEPAARSSSQPANTKPRKTSEKEAQTKRLLSNKLNKPIVKPAAKPAASPRPAPAPAKKDKAAKPSGKKVLSSELIIDSDEEADQASQPLQTKPAQPSKKPLPKPVQAKKRPRDEETETSDSSIPLSKKVRKDVPPPPQRVASASQVSNATSNSTVSSNSFKNKNTSPHKSSPLASSPPTNASEFDNNSGRRTTSSSSASPAPYIGNKTSRSPIHKRHHKSSSVTSSSSSNGSTRYLKPELVDTARKYRSFYPKYEELHRELANSRYRDVKKEKTLLDMHERLAKMKQQINEGIVEM